MSDETTMLQSLSKLKKAGKLRYWRGTIEIPETELHAICDEIQAEHDQAIAATLGSDDEYEAKMDELLCRLTNGKWSKSRSYSLEFMESCIRDEFEQDYADEEAKLRDALNEVAEKWAKEQIEAEDYARENLLLKAKLDATLGVADKGVPQGAGGHLDKAQIDWLRFMPDGWDGAPPTIGSGTLTAEQVREAIYDHSTYANYDGTQYYASGIRMQAIADELNATLGSGTKGCENLLWELVGALDVADATDASKKPIVAEYARRIAATLGSGTLTAEKVRETVEKHWHDLPEEYDMPEATALPEHSYDWQAIADELNATLGSESNADVDDVLGMVDELRDDGTLDYGQYSSLFDAIATLGSGECETRWFELFGTPEKAAETLEKLCAELDDWCSVFSHCRDCMFGHEGEDGVYACWAEPEEFSLLEWLRGKVVKR